MPQFAILIQFSGNSNRNAKFSLSSSCYSKNWQRYAIKGPFSFLLPATRTQKNRFLLCARCASLNFYYANRWHCDGIADVIGRKLFLLLQISDFTFTFLVLSTLNKIVIQISFLFLFKISFVIHFMHVCDM